MRPDETDEIVHQFPWLPSGWKFLKAKWQGEILTCLQPCPAMASGQRTAANQFERERRLEAVLTGSKPGTTIQLATRPLSGWAAKVFAALREIPFGTTITYGDLASLAGNPLAARAAARVCASNRICLVVPCHRVLPKAGGFGGFHWGTKLKQEILVWEKAENSAIRPA